MLETLKWMNVKQRIMYRTMVVVFQIKNKMLPDYLTRKISYIGDINTHNVRSANDFRIDKETRKSTLHIGMKMFNELPNYIKSESEIKKFKRLVIDNIKDKFVIRSSN